MEKVKAILYKIWIVIKYVAVTLFFGIAAIFLFRNKKSEDEINKAEKAREEKKDELEKKSPNDIAADSPNADSISANIEREQENLRQRLRDRFDKTIHRSRSSGNN